jgi:hypothetical protein
MTSDFQFLRARSLYEDGLSRGARLQRDIDVNSDPPDRLPLNRNVGNSATQNARAQHDAARLVRAGAVDVQINQHQINAAGERVGINRPDLQYTNLRTGERVLIEYQRA